MGDIYIIQDTELTTRSGKRAWPHKTKRVSKKGKRLGLIARILKKGR
jgi:hypothetical protein